MDFQPRKLQAPPDALLAALLAAALFSLDLSLTSYFNNFDGVACAMAVETGNLRRLAHGNHVLYGLLGFAFDGLWRLLGYRGPAMLSLGVFNRLLHAAAGSLMFLLLRRLGASRKGAACGALGLAFSFSSWFYALEPQVYLLGLAGLLAASLALFTERPSPARVGLFHALAVGGHATHILLLPCAAWTLWDRNADGQGLPRLRRYLLALGGGVLAVYALGALATQPKDGRDFMLWLEGTAAIGLDRSFAWHGSFKPLLWSKGLVLALWAQKGVWGLQAVRGNGFNFEAFLTFFALSLGFYGTALRKSGPQSGRKLAEAFALWLAAYLLFFSTWEPDNPNYHLGDLIPFWVLATLALDAWHEPGRYTLPMAAFALFSLNLQNGIAPLLNRDANPLLAQMDELRERTPDNAWVATGGDLGMVYIPYFAHRRPLVLRERANRPEVFNLEEPVYVLPQILSDPQWGPYLRGRFKLIEEKDQTRPLYRLEKL